MSLHKKKRAKILRSNSVLANSEPGTHILASDNIAIPSQTSDRTRPAQCHHLCDTKGIQKGGSRVAIIHSFICPAALARLCPGLEKPHNHEGILQSAIGPNCRKRFSVSNPTRFVGLESLLSVANDVMINAQAPRGESSASKDE